MYSRLDSTVCCSENSDMLVAANTCYLRFILTRHFLFNSINAESCAHQYIEPAVKGFLSHLH